MGNTKNGVGNFQASRGERERIEKDVEDPGIDPGTSRMLSERSTIWASPPTFEVRILHKLLWIERANVLLIIQWPSVLRMTIIFF